MNMKVHYKDALFIVTHAYFCQQDAKVRQYKSLSLLNPYYSGTSPIVMSEFLNESDTYHSLFGLVVSRCAVRQNSFHHSLFISHLVSVVEWYAVDMG